MAKQVLTKKIAKAYTDSIGMIRFVIYIRKNAIYPVPLNKNHIDVAAAVLGTTKEEIMKKPEVASDMIGVVATIKEDVFEEAVVGGMTTLTGAGVRYQEKDVEKAGKTFYNFIKNGEIAVSKNLKFTISKQFISK